MNKVMGLLLGFLMSGYSVADPMVVHALVVGTCTFAQPNDVILDFGNLIAGQGDQQRSVDVKFSCTSGMPYNVALGNGQNMSAMSRRMALQGKKDFLPYNLTSSPKSGIGQGEGKMLNVKLTGTVAGSDYSRVSAGEYSDVVVLTVSP
jgi:spore coat protein U-like protein